MLHFLRGICDSHEQKNISTKKAYLEPSLACLWCGSLGTYLVCDRTCCQPGKVTVLNDTHHLLPALGPSYFLSCYLLAIARSPGSACFTKLVKLLPNLNEWPVRLANIMTENKTPTKFH